jgi:hypothetical protein
VPDDLELMAVYRLGYLPPEQRRPAIDWSSHQRKLVSQYVFRENCDEPQQGWDSPPPGAGAPPAGSERSPRPRNFTTGTGD